MSLDHLLSPSTSFSHIQTLTTVHKKIYCWISLLYSTCVCKSVGSAQRSVKKITFRIFGPDLSQFLIIYKNCAKRSFKMPREVHCFFTTPAAKYWKRNISYAWEREHFQVFVAIFLLLDSLQKDLFNFTRIQSLLVNWCCHCVEPRPLVSIQT